MQTRYVVDTTILVSWLLNPDKLTGKIVRSLELELLTPYKTVNELWKHQRDWIRRRPNLKLEEFTDAIGYYVSLEMVDEGSGELKEAHAIMDAVDRDDVEFLALAIRVNAPIWSHDNHFREQTRVDTVTSREILRGSHELPSLWESLKDEWFKQRSQRHP